MTNKVIANTFHLKKAIHYIVLQGKYCLTVMVYILKKKKKKGLKKERFKKKKNVTTKKP